MIVSRWIYSFWIFRSLHIEQVAGGLHYAAQAQFQADSERVECAPSTRESILKPVFRWSGVELTDGPLEHEIPSSIPILWLNGLAGTGKSTLAQTIARRCKKEDRLGASFFCARFGGRSDVKLIFPTIAHQLASLSEEFRGALVSAAQKNPDIHLHRPADQLETLIVEPLKRAAAAGAPIRDKVVIIDALDECRDSAPVSVILTALSQHIESLEGLQIVVTSRPEDHINQGFLRGVLRDKAHSFRLNDLPPEVVHADIKAYLEYQLRGLASRNPLLQDSPDWPGDEIIERICVLSKRLFIFAATTVKYVAGGQYDDPNQRLSILLSLEYSHVAANDVASPFAHLDELYLQVLRTAFAESIAPVHAAIVKVVMGSVALVFEQLSPASLDSLLRLPKGKTRQVFQHLGSVFVIPQNKEGVIEIIHPSFADFLLDTTRCTLTHLSISPSFQHTILAISCLNTMNGMLKKDMFRLGNTTFNSDISDLHSRISEKVPQHLLYACRNWMDHARLGHISSDILGLLESFCQHHMLQWLEVLSVVGAVDLRICDGLQAIQNILKVTRVLYCLPVCSQYPIIG